MPQIFKFGGYIIFFWSNENKPTESIHVHIAEHNPKDLRKLLAFIEANSNEIIQKWYEYFGEISYYC